MFCTADPARSGDATSMKKIEVTVGEMIKEVGRFKDAQPVESGHGFGADLGKRLEIVHD